MRNILAIIIGLFVGGMTNGAITKINGTLIPLPEGVDMSTTQGVAEAMSVLEFKHFAIVFLAHAVGTLVAALVATLIAKPKRRYIPIIIGLAFLIGGSIMVYLLPNAPILFSITDLLFAYLPMAFLGYALIKLPISNKEESTTMKGGKYS